MIWVKEVLLCTNTSWPHKQTGCLRLLTRITWSSASFGGLRRPPRTFLHWQRGWCCLDHDHTWWSDLFQPFIRRNKQSLPVSSNDVSGKYDGIEKIRYSLLHQRQFLSAPRLSSRSSFHTRTACPQTERQTRQSVQSFLQWRLIPSKFCTSW